MIASDARPKLAPKARLKLDKPSGRYLLVYPEAALQLNTTSAEVVRRCTGDKTLAAIVDELAEAYPGAGRERIAREAETLVQDLVSRTLLVLMT